MTAATATRSLFQPLPLTPYPSDWTAGSAASHLAARRGGTDRAFSGSQALLSMAATVALVLITTTDAGRMLASVFPAAKMASVGHAIVSALPLERLGGLINTLVR